MKKSLKHLLMMGSLVLMGIAAAAASIAAEYPRTMNFINMLHNKDVSVGEVEAILQDHQGLMWLGGRDALLRYDGYEFSPVSVRTKPGDPATDEPVIQVLDLFEDSRKDLWVATRLGLFKFDRNNDVLVRLEQQNGQPLDIYRGTTNRVVEAPTGEMIAASYGGLVIIDPVTLNAKILTHSPDAPQGMANNVVRDLIVDKEGTVWLGTEAGISRLDWSSMTFTHFVPDVTQPSSIPDNSVWALERDANGYLWVGVRNGLYRFDVQTQQFTRYRHEQDNPASLAGDFVYDLFVDSDERLWVGSDSGGLSLYEPEQDHFIRFASDGKVGTLATSSIRRIYQDRTGDVWVGNYPTGLSFHNRSTAAFSVLKHEPGVEQSLMTDNIGAVLEDRDGNMWIGAGGVTRVDGDTGEITHYRHTSDKTSRIHSSAMISGFVDSDGDIWFGTWAGGLHRYNAQTDRFDQIPFDESLAKTGLKTSDKLNDNVVWHIAEDRDKNLWVATHNGGLSRYDKHTGMFTIFEQDLSKPDSIINQLVWTALEDSAGRFWVGTASGLELMDRDKGTFKHYRAGMNPSNGLATDSIMAIFEDSKKRVWFGTDSGIYLYQEQTDTFQVFNAKNGFADNGIRAITEDEMGNLWLGTNNGVVVFNPDTKEVNNYQTYNGEKIGGFNLGAAVATRRGEIALGGLNGVRLFDTKKLGSNPHVPPVVITDFRLFTNPVPINGADGILDKSIRQTEQVTLDYKKTMVSFGFAALSYRNPEKNQYAYKLEGFDDEWRHVGDQRTALYTNLSAGKYTFRVKASNNDGLWNEQGASIAIRQLPPPWKTWWAYTIYGLMVLGLLALFVQSQRKKRRLIEEQNRILELRVAERTTELRAKNDDIKAMLSNMRQGLFTVEPNGAVHQEYSLYLHTIFETEDLAGRSAVELLFEHAQLGGDTLDQAKEAIGSIIGEDEMNFEFNSHLLPTEYEVRIGDGSKHLALDWNPIIVNDVVNKLMVSVRDVTQLKQMESEAKAKQRELDIISQLLNIPAKKYLSFAESAKTFIAENRRFVRANKSKDDGVIALLFRNMHTIKGNSRTFGFSDISNAAHQAESLYSELKASSDGVWQPEVMLADLDTLESVLDEYEVVYFDVLGRGKSASPARDQNGFWADATAVAAISQYIDSVEERFPSLRDMPEGRPIRSLLDGAISSPLSAMLVDVVDSLPTIAPELGKEPPKVTIEDGNARIKNQSEEMINNIFAHILRNSLDHGIESPEDRLAKGKPAQGSIDIYTIVENDRLHIHIKDDGRGLDLSRLYKKGSESGKWSKDAALDSQQIGELIFTSGVSTKDQVTDISGRGVGMDAVRQFVINSGGDISLRFTGSKQPTTVDPDRPTFAAFELVVSLPADTYLIDDSAKPVSREAKKLA